VFSGGRGEEGAHCARCPALAADHLAEVVLGHLELDDGLIAAVVRMRIDRLGIIDERLATNSISSSMERDYAVLFFFSNDFTVGESCAPLLTQ